MGVEGRAGQPLTPTPKLLPFQRVITLTLRRNKKINDIAQELTSALVCLGMTYWQLKPHTRLRESVGMGLGGIKQ